MKIAIMSDSHDHWVNMRSAIQIANTENCEILLHAGDLVDPSGVAVLQEFNSKVHYVWGNNEKERDEIITLIAAADNIVLEGEEMSVKIEELIIFMSHYPHISTKAFETGKYDLVVYGHSHQYYVEHNEKNAVLLNPGEIYGKRTGQAGFVIFDTKMKTIRRIEL